MIRQLMWVGEYYIVNAHVSMTMCVGSRIYTVDVHVNATTCVGM